MSSENGEKTAEISTLEQRIIRQVEYYFGDANLTRDRFLQSEIKENEGGWVTMETMLKFNRLSSLSEDIKMIVEALKKSTAGLMEIHEDGTKIRRSPDKPLPSNTLERREDVKDRSAYVKGFPTTLTMNEILDWFDEYGPPDNVQMRRDAAREFKGSVFVLFKTKEDLGKFLAVDSKYEETELIKMLKDDYFKKKADEKKIRRDKNVLEEEEKSQQKIEEERQRVLDGMVKGAILHVKGLGENNNIYPKEIREFFTTGAEVAWVEFEKGDDEAWIRLGEEGGAQKAWDAAKNSEGKVIFKEKELTHELVEGEAEFIYWKNRFQAREDQKKSRLGRGFQRGRGRGRGGGRGGRWGRWGGRRGGRRNRDDDSDGGSGDDEPSSKKVKTEDGAGDGPAVKSEKDNGVKAEAVEKA
ncbi:lupus La protein-like [Lineus longissimus]|uniref:lupus La protein-like n=1 Tax=Lineus longissimus TaxID=88925 RepID=UPI002B4E64C7